MSFLVILYVYKCYVEFDFMFVCIIKKNRELLVENKFFGVNGCIVSVWVIIVYLKCNVFVFFYRIF